MRGVGSPPHVWGNRHHVDPCITRSIRFTPTRVGKSDTTAVLTAIATVHPHTCGEISARSASRSPGRFTPTRVGKSRTPTVECQSPTVHPHTCGEITCAADDLAQRRTVHPHTCGENVGRRRRRAGIDRFTPTRVGKSTVAWLEAIDRHTVHPHTCGEIDCSAAERRCVRFTPTRVGKSVLDGHQLRPSGSPPRVWGNRGPGSWHAWRIRFTPTRVGKSRGVTCPLAIVRFTPTRVGKSARIHAMARPATVHPHACGEIGRVVDH